MFAVFFTIFLVIQFLVFPNLVWWQPQAEKLLTTSFGQQTTVTGLHGRFEGLSAIIGIDSIRIGSNQQDPALQAAGVLATFNPRTLLSGVLWPDKLTLASARLQIERTAYSRFQVGGIGLAIPFSHSDGSDQDSIVREPWQLPSWILSKKSLNLNGIEIFYKDQETGATLTAHDLSLSTKQIDGQHSLVVEAPRFSDQPGSIKFETTLSRDALAGSTTGLRWQGQAKLAMANFDAMQLSALSRSALNAAGGSLNLQATFNFANSAPSSATLVFDAQKLSIPTDEVSLEIPSVSASVAADWARDGGVRFVLQEASLVGQDSSDIDISGSDQFAVLDPQLRLIQSQIRLKNIDLRSLSEFAKVLPLRANLNSRLAQTALSGTIEHLNLKFDAQSKPIEYQLDAVVANLSFAGDKRLVDQPPQKWSPRVPAFANISGTVQADKHGGSARFGSSTVERSQSRNAKPPSKTSVFLAGIFAEPKTEFDHLAADLSWKILTSKHQSQALGSAGFSVEIRQFDMANGDAEGAVTGTYTKKPGRMGIADLAGWLKRVKASRVPKYLPLNLPVDVSRWLREAKPLGVSNDVKWVVNGELDKFPFRRPDKGEFLIDATVSQASLTYAPNWPRATDVKAKLRFQRDGMQIDMIDGLLFDGVPVHNGQVSIDEYRDATLSLTGSTTGSAQQALRFGLATPLARNISQSLRNLIVSGDSKADIHLNIPLTQVAAIEYQGKSNLTNIRVDLGGDIPTVSKINGDIIFKNGVVQADSLQGQFLGSPFRLNVQRSPKQPVKLEVNGQASADAIRQLVAHPLTSALSGKTGYLAKLNWDQGRLSVSLSSNLKGLGIALPNPFQKSVSSEVPLTLDWNPLRPKDYSFAAANERDELSINYGGLAHAIFQRQANAQGVMRVERGTLAIGRKATLPASGLSVDARTQSINVDQWLKLIQSHGLTEQVTSFTRDGVAPNTGYFDGFDLRPTSTKIEVKSATFSERQFNNVAINATRQAQRWKVKVDSDQVTGDAFFASGNALTPDEFLAKFSRF